MTKPLALRGRNDTRPNLLFLFARCSGSLWGSGLEVLSMLWLNEYLGDLGISKRGEHHIE